jgi:hypothetical protein
MKLCDVNRLLPGVPIIENPPPLDYPGRRYELKDGESGDALAAAALTHKAEGLTARDGEADVIYGTYNAIVSGKYGAEPQDLKQRFCQAIPLS